MGRPTQCNPCCGGSEQPPPPPPDNPFDDYYCNWIFDCDGYGWIDDYIIVFQRINNSPISFSYYYYDIENYNGEEDRSYWGDGCYWCIKGSNLITGGSCTIAPNNTNPFPCGSDTVRHGYCGGYEFIIIRDAFLPENILINNAIIIGRSGFWRNCCAYFGYRSSFEFLYYAKCACLTIYVPAESVVTIEYYDCYLETMVGLSITNTEPYIVNGGNICIPPYSWGNLAGSIRDGWVEFLCDDILLWDSCSYDNNITSDIDSIFGDRIKIISGDPVFSYAGVCEYDDSAPQCLKDRAIQCGE